MLTANECIIESYDAASESKKVNVVEEIRGLLSTLLNSTTITTDGTVNGTAITGLDLFRQAVFTLKVSSKTMDAGTTLDIYIQYSPDEGTTWDDLYHFTQITDTAIGNGTYVAYLAPASTSISDAAVSDGALAAATFKDVSFCDRLRVKTVAANFSADTITVEVLGYFTKS